MRLLILGGTQFIGPHIIEEALARGLDVTIFNRGKTNPEMFPELTRLKGDRLISDLEALRDQPPWDLVIDTCAYIPRVVRELAEILQGKAKTYLLVSTISVYQDFAQNQITESYPTATLEHPVEEVTGETYGALKALCEVAAHEAFEEGTRVLVVRPGLIVGPRDPTDRFTRWPAQLWRAKELVAPGTPQDPVQVIDARDLATFMLDIAQSPPKDSCFNVVGPAPGITMGQMLLACQKAAIQHGGEGGELRWVEASFLQEQQVSPWGDLPCWVEPGSQLEGISTISNQAALQAGLRTRSIQETASDTLAWWLDQNREDEPLRAGLTREREAELLKLWREQ